MNFMLVSSLKHIALVRIAIELWNHDDIKEDMKLNRRTEAEAKLIKKITQLPLPEILKKVLICSIEPIGSQILQWMNFFTDYYSNSFAWEYINEIQWTPQGKIDKRKTAELFCRKETLDIRRRFELAYTYCCEDQIIILWNKIPDFHKIPLLTGFRRYHQYPLKVYWTRYSTNCLGVLENIIRQRHPDSCLYKEMFHCTVHRENVEAVKYFWHKLTPQQKKRNLMSGAISAINNSNLDSVLFLISQMTQDKQMNLFKKYSFSVLKIVHTKDWLWLEMFFQIAELVTEFLNEEEYIAMLSMVAETGDKQHMKDFWLQRASNYKKRFKDDIDLLIDLFNIGDVQIIKWILDEKIVELKKCIHNTSKGVDICTTLICKNKWRSLELLFEGSLSEEKLNFKKNLVSVIGYRICMYFLVGKNWQSLETFLNWCFPNKEEIHNYKIELEKRAILSE